MYTILFDSYEINHTKKGKQFNQYKVKYNAIIATGELFCYFKAIAYTGKRFYVKKRFYLEKRIYLEKRFYLGKRF